MLGRLLLPILALLASGPIEARDYLYNSGFVIVQRGTGPWVLGEPLYTVDRWAARRAGGGATASRLVTTSATGARYKLRVGRDHGDTSTQPIVLYQALDSGRSRELAGRQITFSFSAQAGRGYSPASAALVSRVTFGKGLDEPASGAPAAAWIGAAYDDKTHGLNGALGFSHTVTVPLTATQVGFSLLMWPAGMAGVEDWFEVEATKVELGANATPYQGQSDDAAYEDCALFYEDLARHPFTGYRHLRTIAIAFANGVVNGVQKWAALIRHKTKRDFNYKVSLGPPDSWHITAFAGASYYGFGNVMSSHETVGESMLQFEYVIDGAHPAFPDGWPAFVALDGGRKASKFAISAELAP
jgi:hypothetical protein